MAGAGSSIHPRLHHGPRLFLCSRLPHSDEAFLLVAFAAHGYDSVCRASVKVFPHAFKERSQF